jgi:Holliday junction resolvase RusA-like endonuclease
VARGVPELDLLGGIVEPGNSEQQAAAQVDIEPVTVIIDGPAIAKGRPRFTHRGIAYTPANTRKYEAHARLCAQLAMDGRSPISGPVKLTILVELPVPASWSKRRRAAAIVGQIRPTSRPDLDNYTKAAADACNGIVFVDDRLIVDSTATKRYGVNPKLVLTVMPLAAQASNGVAS